MTSWMISNYLNAGHVPHPLGNHSHTSAPSGTFRTRDGVINLVNNEQKQFEATCDALDMPELKTDPRFLGRDERMRNQAVLLSVLEARLMQATSAEWEQRLSAAGVPVGPVLTVPQIAEHEHLRERGVVHTVHAPAIGRDIKVAGLGFILGGRPVEITTPPPVLGEHTEEVLRSIGCTEAELTSLRAEGVI
jgi:formyl-CoA transferase